MADQILDFTPPPTLRDFMLDDSLARFAVGPVGSGKTTACIYELLRRAVQQARGSDGLRRTRFAIVRNTLQQIRTTVLKDIEQLLSPLLRFKVYESTIYLNFSDVRSEWLLIPLDTVEDQRRLLSTQLTGAWVNEFVEVNPDLIRAVRGRLGRYPSRAVGGPSWHGLIGDSNPGTTDSPWHAMLVEDLPEGWAYFQQPGGMVADVDSSAEEIRTEYHANPLAENVENLPPNYYVNLTHGATDEWIERYVCGQWGHSLAGQAVFKASFVPSFHVASSALTPSPNRPVVVGMDFARHPAAVLGQIDARGRLLVLAEIERENCGVEKFTKDELLPLLMSDRFCDLSSFIVGDPSGMAASQIGEESVFGCLRDLGFDAYPAMTNSIDPRLRAVESWLLQQRDGKAGMLFDPEYCPKLITAMRGKYKYASKKNGQLEDKPAKIRPWADLADALQYLCLGVGRNTLGRIMAKRSRLSSSPPPDVPASGWT